jgi:hypothetical protein
MPSCATSFREERARQLGNFGVGELKAEPTEDWVMQEVNEAPVHKKRIGRPPTIVDGYRVVELRAQGASWREIASRLAVGATTARRALSRLAKSLPKPSSES